MTIDSQKNLCLMNEFRIAHDTLRLGWGYLQSIGLGNDQYFTAFYFLATGLERYMKSCCCIIQKAENGKYPTAGELKNKFGHDLVELKNTLVGNYESYIHNSTEITFLKSDNVLVEIVSMLSNFAKNARYYNLDFVTNTNSCMTLDITSEWEQFEVDLGAKLNISFDLATDPYPQINACIVGALERFIKNITDILYQQPMFDICSSYITCVTMDFRMLTDFGTHNYRQDKMRKFDPNLKFIEFTNEALQTKKIPYKILNRTDYSDAEWPFIVDQVTVMNLGHSALAVGIDGLLYGLNGLALAQFKLPNPHDMDVAKMGCSVEPFMEIACNLTEHGR